MENVSSLMGTILCNQFMIYSNDHGINYIARITNTQKNTGVITLLDFSILFAPRSNVRSVIITMII